MAGIFKAYDIRGIYGDTLTDSMAQDIGRAFVTFLGCKKVVIGYDCRPHSIPLMNSLTKGITDQGADVINIGMCSTPMCYFANGSLKADAGIMITASHNPKEWNGFKLCRAQAVPISGDTGIKDIEKLVAKRAFGAAPRGTGKVTQHDIGDEYGKHVAKHAVLKRPLRIAADYANAMGILEARKLKDILAIDGLYDSIDGNFPNHEANPLNHETLSALRNKVVEGGYDFGVAYDGDADRTGFIDEKGQIVPMDMITILVAKSMLDEQKGTILYDLRSSWAVKEVIKESGGIPKMCRVGHAFIKNQMREVNAMFAGELSGHYYFRDNYFTESSAMATLAVAKIVSASKLPLSEMVKPFQRYVASGEINSETAHSARVLEELKVKYSGGKAFELDGLSVEFDNWWFNVRISNTEPLMRLNLEAKTRNLMEEKRNEILAIIRHGE